MEYNARRICQPLLITLLPPPNKKKRNLGHMKSAKLKAGTWYHASDKMEDELHLVTVGTAPRTREAR